MSNELKIKEALLKRRAWRQGLVLKKSRRRDPKAVDFGKYALLLAGTSEAINRDGPISPYSLTMEEVELSLEGG